MQNLPFKSLTLLPVFLISIPALPALVNSNPLFQHKPEGSPPLPAISKSSPNSSPLDRSGPSIPALLRGNRALPASAPQGLPGPHPCKLLLAHYTAHPTRRHPSGPTLDATQSFSICKTTRHAERGEGINNNTKFTIASL